MRFAIIFLFLAVITLGNALKCMRQHGKLKAPQDCGKDENRCLTHIKKTEVHKYCAKSSECKSTSFLALPTEKVTCCEKDMCNQ
ncbi:hypothetical protein XENTR_v10023412 [Xenopus tropicalis]|uniref:Xenoxin-1 isoform X1 n=1 Tax=Xenopus tropicalis TaxID=8364 RepID=A0A8J1IVG4_XENTR|nr:xenoxin-1 isoform X1 [Xenopus tropicalis]KAE8578237.1 hypothetical protein XENTR_v10023412 [Xenopus tropicalis]